MIEKPPGAAGKTGGNGKQAQCQMLGQPLHLSSLSVAAGDPHKDRRPQDTRKVGITPRVRRTVGGEHKGKQLSLGELQRAESDFLSTEKHQGRAGDVYISWCRVTKHKNWKGPG